MSNLRILYELTQDKSLIPNKILQLWALECTKHVYPIWAAKCPGDKRIWDCLVRTEEYLNGKCSKEELIKAKNAANDAYTAANAANAAVGAINAAYAAINVANAAANAAAYAAYAAAFAANAAAYVDAARAVNVAANAAANAAAIHAINSYAARAVNVARATKNREEEEKWQRNKLLELLDNY